VEACGGMVFFTCQMRRNSGLKLRAEPMFFASFVHFCGDSIAFLGLCHRNDARGVAFQNASQEDDFQSPENIAVF
jgi:hypothetical protein